MVTEPIFLKQISAVQSPQQRCSWFAWQATAAIEAGCKFLRFSEHPRDPNVIVIEGWAERWPEDKGEPRFSRQQLGG